MNSVTVSKRQIMGLLKTAGKLNIRYYLNGILLDFDAGVMVSTNGHFMMVFKPDVMKGKGQIIVPRELLENIIKLVPNGLVSYDTTIELEADAGMITAKYRDNVMQAPHVDGKFPDYTRVVPEKFTGVPSQIKPDLYADSGTALKFCAGTEVSKSEYPLIAHNGAHKAKGPSGAIMFLAGYDKAFVIIMPFRPSIETNIGIAENAQRIAGLILEKAA